MCQFCLMDHDEQDEGGAAAHPRPRGRHPVGAAEAGEVVRSGRNYAGPFPWTPDRLLGMGIVRLYQLTLSGFIGNSCRHMPTCSEYGYEAIARHGLWAGGWMSFFRVTRCGPGGTSGFDPVPQVLADRYHWFTPWRYFTLGRKADG